MYCLRWWLPVFLLPFPAAPPAFLFLFLISYTLHTRPCVYCGAIIIGLLLSSCYFYTPSEPTWWDVSGLPFMDTRMGFGMSRFLQWLGSPIHAGELWHATPNGACATCWTDFGFGKNRGFFSPTPRYPRCDDSSTYPASPSSSWFIGIPGTALGFYLDTRLFLPA